MKFWHWGGVKERRESVQRGFRLHPYWRNLQQIPQYFDQQCRNL